MRCPRRDESGKNRRRISCQRARSWPSKEPSSGQAPAQDTGSRREFLCRCPSQCRGISWRPAGCWRYLCPQKSAGPCRSNRNRSTWSPRSPPWRRAPPCWARDRCARSYPHDSCRKSARPFVARSRFRWSARATSQTRPAALDRFRAGPAPPHPAPRPTRFAGSLSLPGGESSERITGRGAINAASWSCSAHRHPQAGASSSQALYSAAGVAVATGTGESPSWSSRACRWCRASSRRSSHRSGCARHSRNWSRFSQIVSAISWNALGCCSCNP